MQSLTFVFFAFFASILCALASPVDLEKRITHTGRGTWFEVGLGACGDFNVDSDKIIAISHLRWADGGNCNQWVEITANGKTAFAQTRDECMGCGEDDIDMSPSLFEEFADLGVGVISTSWHFMAKSWSP